MRSSPSHPSLFGPLAVVLALSGCGADSWYRAEFIGTGYLVVRAGLDDDSCLVLYVGDPGTELRGPDGELVEPLAALSAEFPSGPTRPVWASELDVGAEHCAVDVFQSWGTWAEGSRPITSGAGTLRFRAGDTLSGYEYSCEAELSASVEGWVLDETIQLPSYGCPPVEGDTFEVDVLGASSPRTRDDFVAVRSWNEELEICYGLDFVLDDYPIEIEDPTLFMPENWVLVSAEMVVFGSEEDCRTGTWSPAEDGQPRSIGLWGDVGEARGYLRFDASQPWVNPFDDTPTPCEISLDISVDFGALFYWTPTTLRFVADHVPVAQTCGDSGS